MREKLVRVHASAWMLALISLQSSVANAGAAKFSVSLVGASREQIEVIVDTRELGDVVIGEATFSADLRDQQNATIASKTYNFVDSQLPYLTAGHVYRRRYFHRVGNALSVESPGMRIVEQAAGGKADGVDGTVVATSFNVPEPDVSISEPNPAHLAVVPHNFGGAAVAQYSGNAALRARCQNYANLAVRYESFNQSRGCGYAGPRWVANFSYHFDWCASVSEAEANTENTERRRLLSKCPGKNKP